MERVDKSEENKEMCKCVMWGNLVKYAHMHVASVNTRS